MTDEDEHAEGPRVTVTVQIKLPPYWPADPQIWFAQVEAQFATHGINSQQTKFDYIVSSLAPGITTEVQDLILQPPGDTPYNKLKEQLIKRTAALEQKRLQQLFHAEELGDRKPSQFLRRMQQLLGDKARETNNTFLRELFLQRLPPNVQIVLTSTPDTGNLDNLAQLANKIIGVAIPASAIAAVSTTSELEHLHKEVTELKSMLQALQSLGNLVLGDLPAHIGSRKSSVGTTTSMVTMHRNANPHIRSREAPKPLTEGDGHSWPLTQSPILHYSYHPHIWKCSLNLNLGLRRTFRWLFVITNVYIPIIGADFLRHYSLLVDITNS